MGYKKLKRKKELVEYLRETQGIDINPNSILMYKLRDYMNIRDSY